LHLLILDAAGGLAIKKRNGSGHWGKFEKRSKTVSGAGISRNPSGCKTEMRPIGRWMGSGFGGTPNTARWTRALAKTQSKTLDFGCESAMLVRLFTPCEI
jgi:hypothetical protein